MGTLEGVSIIVVVVVRGTMVTHLDMVAGCASCGAEEDREAEAGWARCTAYIRGRVCLEGRDMRRSRKQAAAGPDEGPGEGEEAAAAAAAAAEEGRAHDEVTSPQAVHLERCRCCFSSRAALFGSSTTAGVGRAGDPLFEQRASLLVRRLGSGL